MNLKQGPQEPLREYIDRFNAEVITIAHVQHDVVVLTLMNGLKRGPFRDSLAKRAPHNLAEAMEKADQYIRKEEFNRTMDSIHRSHNDRNDRQDKSEKNRDKK